MPTKNSTKTYVEDGYYHVYNRGVEKRNIFLDSLDYSVFMNYLKEYLSMRDENRLFKLINDPRIPSVKRAKIARSLSLKNYYTEIQLLAYCLMPNHFHFFLTQNSGDSIDRFMSSLCTRYAIYFNRRHKRVGALFQGVYKAVLMTDESQYLHITRYIHKQALSAQSDKTDFPSSYPEYLNKRKAKWVHPAEILSFFSKTNPDFSYERFVLEYNPDIDENPLEEYDI